MSAWVEGAAPGFVGRRWWLSAAEAGRRMVVEAASPTSLGRAALVVVGIGEGDQANSYFHLVVAVSVNM